MKTAPRFLIAITLGLLAATPVRASLVEVQAGTYGSGYPNTYYGPFLTNPTGPINTSVNVNAGSGVANAKLGEWSASSQIVGLHNNALFSQLQLRTQSALFERMTIDAPGLTGQTGHVTLSFKVVGHATLNKGLQSAGPTVSYGYDLSVNADNGAPPDFAGLYIEGQVANHSYLNDQGALGGDLKLGTQVTNDTFSFVFGTPFEMNLLIKAFSRHYVQYDGSGSCDLTVTWNGFGPVTVNGQPVPIFSTHSDSGFAYQKTAGKCDFSADGRPDLLLVNPATRQSSVNVLNGTASAGVANGPIITSGWQLVDAADFDRDGKQDYVIFNPTTRQTAIWYLNGVTFLRGAFGPTLPAGYVLAAASDFNADGKPDLVLLNPATRQTLVWFLNNNAYVSSANGPVLPAGYALSGVADFDKDTKPDFVLFNPNTRVTAIWYLNGTAFRNAAFGPAVNAGYTLGGVGDFNADGKPDFILLNPAANTTAFWFLNNTAHVSSAFGPTLAAGNLLVAP